MIENFFTKDLYLVWIMVGTFGIVTVMYGILGYKWRKVAQKKGIEKFYFGELVNRKSLSKSKEIPIDEIAIYIMLLLSICLMNGVIGASEELRFLWNGAGEYVDELPTVMITTYITLITMLGLFANLDKEEYIVFSINDVIEKFDIKVKMKWMAIFTITSYIFYFISSVLKNINSYGIYFGIKSIVLITFLLYFATFFYIIFIIIDLILGKEVEKKMLENLYRELWYYPRKTIKKTFNFSDFDYQIEYLLEQYIDSIKKINFKKIKDVEYNTNLNYDNKLRFRQMCIRCSIKVWLFLGVAFLLTNSILFKSKQFRIKVFIIYLCLLVFIFVTNMIFKSLATLYIGIIYSGTSYRFSFNKGMDRYAPDRGILNFNRYRKFVRRTKNILAYSLLILENNGEEELYQKIIEACRSKVELADEIKIIQIILDYFYYKKYEKRVCTDIKIEDVNRYRAYIKSFILNIEREVKKDKMSEESVNKYIQTYYDKKKRNA